MISSRNISDLHPLVQPKAHAFIDACQRRGINIIITCTLRDHEEQARLYAKGRTAPGAIVTNAKPGFSFHNYGMALDFAPLKNGRIDWNDTAEFERVGMLAETIGFEWAGRWKSFKELAHIQWTGGLTIADLQAGKRLA